jgi:hypothetical protein
MERTGKLTRKMLFGVRWLLMPQQKRYAYLWARTKRSLQSRPVYPEHSHTLVGG